jgi:ribosomal protein S18 acetylase RimI-like enzyme
MKIRNINHSKKNINKILPLLSEAFSEDPLFNYYTKGNKKNISKIIKEDLLLHKNAFLRGVFINKKLVSVLVVQSQKCKISVKDYIQSGIRIWRQTNFLTLLRIIKIRWFNFHPYSAERLFYILYIATLPKYQNKGYATKLIKKCIKELKNAPSKGIWLINENKKNCKFYKERGFKQIKVIKKGKINKYYMSLDF